MVKVLIAEGEAIFQLGLLAALAEHEDIDVIGRASDGLEAIDKAKQLDPDVILMDSELPKCDGIEATRLLRELLPEVKAIIMHPPEKQVELLDKALGAGAKGFLCKTVAPSELVAGIIDISRGGTAIAHEVIPLILGKFVGAGERPAIAIVLSSRERQVLAQLAEGKTNRQIGEALFISENTVKTHLRNIVDKLNLKNRNRVELVCHALAHDSQLLGESSETRT